MSLETFFQKRELRPTSQPVSQAFINSFEAGLGSGNHVFIIHSCCMSVSLEKLVRELFLVSLHPGLWTTA